MNTVTEKFAKQPLSFILKSLGFRNAPFCWRAMTLAPLKRTKKVHDWQELGHAVCPHPPLQPLHSHPVTNANVCVYSAA
ncbi:hypothetical protein D3C76_195290 [compost metagenome]